MAEPMTVAEFQAAVGVDDATMARLETYLALLRKWQKAINLVGAKTLEDPWRRHMLDSAQLGPFIPSPAKTLVDLGSGAGFPGLVLAITTGLDVHLVESDGRKCAFLGEVARATGCAPKIHNRRVETLDLPAPDIVTARAFAPLDKLLNLSEKLVGPETVCLFLKGRAVDEELTACAKMWKMAATSHPSRSDIDGKVVELRKVSRRHG